MNEFRTAVIECATFSRIIRTDTSSQTTKYKSRFTCPIPPDNLQVDS